MADRSKTREKNQERQSKTLHPTLFLRGGMGLPRAVATTKSVTRISSGGGEKYCGQVKDAKDNPNQKRCRQIKNVADKAVSEGSNVDFLGLWALPGGVVFESVADKSKTLQTTSFMARERRISSGCGCSLEEAFSKTLQTNQKRCRQLCV